MRSPRSWVIFWSRVALMWQVAQVGAAGVVLADDPGLRIEVHLGDIRAELDAVLGLGVDLGLGMIWAQMTLAAVLGLAGQGRAERMPAVTSGTTSLAAVGIDASDAAVGPGGKVELAVAYIFHFPAVALAAAIHSGRPTFHDLTQHVVERADEVGGVGVPALFELVHLGLVAAGTVVRSHDHGDLQAVVVEGGGVTRVGLVAGIAIHAGLGMGASAPLLDGAGGAATVTLQALLALLGDFGGGLGKAADAEEYCPHAKKVGAHLDLLGSC